MADTLVVQTMFNGSDGPSQLNIEQLTIQNGQANLSVSNPGFLGYNELTAYEQILRSVFVYSTEVDVMDETTGVTYKLTKLQGDGGVGDSPMGPASVEFNITAVDPPFSGTIYGYNPCFATDTLIAVPYGTMAVQDLRAGDVVTTLTGPATVTWIGHRRARDTEVIRIRAGTLRATRDLIVSEDHALYVAGCLVPAGLLVDGEGITRERRDEVTFWHVELEQHAILLAEGVEAESYLDTGNRRQFGNCALAYDPVQAVQDPCAEMVLAGSRLEKLRGLVRVMEAA